MIDARLEAATEEVFAAFARFFGAKWRQTFEDPKARSAWATAFVAARLSPAAIRRGLAKAARLAFVPVLGEFIDLCDQPVPSLGIAMRAASEWSRGSLIAWPHPAIGDAAHQVGSFRLRHLPAADLERAFDRAYRDAVRRHKSGEILTVPELKMLAAPKRAPKRQTDSGRRALAEIGRMLGVQP